jgi:hypothetical protein
MAISSIGNLAVTQIAEAQKIDLTELLKNKPKMTPAGSEDAFSVNISEEALKKAQNMSQNPMVSRTQNKQ